MGKTMVTQLVTFMIKYVMERCVSGGPHCIETTFDLKKVLEKVSARQTDVQFAVSTDAGRYLCDFVYYTSLHADCAPCALRSCARPGRPLHSASAGKCSKEHHRGVTR